jgi:mRNA-degrading endonuclease RelE of RelBE toxin-antitoxin system
MSGVPQRAESARSVASLSQNEPNLVRGWRVRAEVRASLETHLRHEPEKTSRSRIKRLQGLRRPQYRLRVGDIRVFYDLSGTTVEVLAIVAKSEAESWLAQFGNPA